MQLENTRLWIMVGTIVLVFFEGIVYSLMSKFPFDTAVAAQVALATGYAINKTVDNVKANKFGVCAPVVEAPEVIENPNGIFN